MRKEESIKSPHIIKEGEETMTKNLKRKLCMILTVILAVSFNPGYVVASDSAAVTVMNVEQQQELTLDISAQGVYGGKNDSGMSMARAVSMTNCAIRMTYETSSLYMEFVTGCNTEASEIGVKDIEVQKKKGIFWESWETIATSAGNSIIRSDSFIGNCTCTTVVKGETYRVKCTHYAYVGGVYYSLENVTDGHKFN